MITIIEKLVLLIRLRLEYSRAISLGRNPYVETARYFLNYCIFHCRWNFLLNHNISEDRISILRANKHPGYKFIFDECLRKLMEDIDYFNTIANRRDSKSIDLWKLLNKLLFPNQSKIKSMCNYYQINGLYNCLRTVSRLRDNVKCSLNLDDNLGNGLNLIPRERDYEVTFEMPQKSKNLEELQDGLSNHDITIDERAYHITKYGCNVEWQDNFIAPIKVTVHLDNIYTAGLDLKKQYYLRYITEIPDDSSDFASNIEKRRIRVDGRADYLGLHFNIKGNEVFVVKVKFEGKQYLIIDVKEKIDYYAMMNLSFATFVAIGMFHLKVYLDKCWIIASNEGLYIQPCGLIFRSLVPTIKYNIPIFSQNVIQTMTTMGERIFKHDKLHRSGSGRAFEIVNNLRLGLVITPIKEQVFGNIVDNFLKYEGLLRGVFIIESSMHSTLELMPAAFSVALEAITNVSYKILDEQKKSQIDKVLWKKEVRPAIEKVLEHFVETNKISSVEKGNLDKKLNDMNRAFNSDKLSSLLIHYNYPLTSEDKDYLKKRNYFLHGRQDNKENMEEISDHLFASALALHRLCFSTVLLMAGYDGYILNNLRIFNLSKKGKVFIKIPRSKSINKIEDNKN